MTETPESPEKEECVSDKPWSVVLNKAAKLGTINLFKEGGGSIGRFLFIPLTVLFVLFAASYALDYFTGWLSAVFDFWPFNRMSEEVVPVVQEEARPWYQFWGGEESAVDVVPELVVVEPVAVESAGEKTPWYCNFNPIC